MIASRNPCESHTFAAMGGTVEVQLVNRPAAAADGIEALFASYERTMSRFLPDSELNALNASAGAPFAASPVLFDAVGEEMQWARATDGIFDPTVIDELEAAGHPRVEDHHRRVAEGRVLPCVADAARLVDLVEALGLLQAGRQPSAIDLVGIQDEDVHGPPPRGTPHDVPAQRVTTIFPGYRA